MRHLKLRHKFSRTPAHRKALFRNLSTALIRDEKCITTLDKAKALRSVVEKLITLARKDTLHARRQAYSYIQSKEVVHKLFADIAPRYSGRPGGYTRVLRTATRHGDAAERAVIQLVEAKVAEAPKKTRTPRKKKAAAPEESAPKAE